MQLLQVLCWAALCLVWGRPLQIRSFKIEELASGLGFAPLELGDLEPQQEIPSTSCFRFQTMKQSPTTHPSWLGFPDGLLFQWKVEVLPKGKKHTQQDAQGETTHALFGLLDMGTSGGSSSEKTLSAASKGTPRP